MRIFIIITFVIQSCVIFAQKAEPIWFNLEPKVGIANTVLLNNNVLDDDEISFEYKNISPVFGAGLGVQFTPKFSFQFDVLKATYAQKLKYKVTFPDNDIKVNTTDMVFLLRKCSPGMTYAGIGLKQSLISTVYDNNPLQIDAKNKINKNFTSIILDFGYIIYHHNIFDVNLNLRLGYAFGDVVSDKDFRIGKHAGGTATSVVGSSSGGYKATNPASIQLTLNFNWHMGYFATSKCKRRTGFVFFSYDS